MLVAGARPNFMKVAPIIKAIGRFNSTTDGSNRKLEYILVHTGQHYDEKMSEVFFRELGIPKPDVNLEVGSGSHAVQTASIMTRFEPVLVRFNPDWLVVVGDVNSTMACALVAAKSGVKVAHVEAGLRSFDRTMPEEINRLVTDSISDLLLTPSEDADTNLANEGVPLEKIRQIGNVMIDSLVENLPAARSSRILENNGLKAGEFCYVTLHRPANVDRRESLVPIMAHLGKLSRRLSVVFPMHPRTRKMLVDHEISLSEYPELRIIEPIGYHDSLKLTENARFVLTDSGGLQEESTYFRTPCLTLRPNTERPVTILVGSNLLTSLQTLEGDITNICKGPDRRGSVPPNWDGRTGDRVLQALVNLTS